jgi:hypothetical protein
VAVRAITGEGRTLVITGAAASPLDAIAFAQALETEARFPAARLVSFAPAAEGGEFTVEAER